MIITIDGPSGSGKSTLAILLAKHLNFFCLNSGYLYRGVAYVLKQYYGYDDTSFEAVDVADVTSLLQSGVFRYEYESGLATIYFKDVNITQFLKNIDITTCAAKLGKQQEIRQAIRVYKRQLASNKNIVIEGRVTGSVVFPNAEVKLYVVASDDIRAERFMQLQAQRGITVTQQEALDLLKKRDETDKNRIIDPLVVPEGAVIIDTSQLSKEQAVQKALDVVKVAIEK
ncbi:MAG: hypothetical protein CL947_00015 [Epsilonproteobacteria bacterium]|nr:hypothetical protein [Campylobacterota bacterium]|tara:strand:+ start:3946 stop:4629 length:684 start_codon:yes stop_codon:yes gene_type:complete